MLRVSALEIKNIGPFKTEVIDFSIQQEHPDIHIFTGVNGSGKTTLLHAIASSFDHFEKGHKEHLSNLFYKSNPVLFNRADKFLSRYGINSPKRKKAREHLFRDVINFLRQENVEDLRQRKDFKYRHVFDYAKRFLNMN